LGDGGDSSQAQNFDFGGTDNPAQSFIKCPRQQVESVCDQIFSMAESIAKSIIS
jgi:hypothetical protein